MINTVERIKSAIVSLPEGEYSNLRKWFTERDWSLWDKQIVDDSNSGKLDFLVQEAFEERDKGKLKEL